MEDWYKMSPRDIIQKGGKSILQHYGSSLFKALASVYPQHTWDSNRFTPSRTWTMQEQKIFFDELARKLNIKSPGDWYNVRQTDLIKNGGRSILYRHNNSLIAGREPLLCTRLIPFQLCLPFILTILGKYGAFCVPISALFQQIRTRSLPA